MHSDIKHYGWIYHCGSIPNWSRFPFFGVGACLDERNACPPSELGKRMKNIINKVSKRKEDWSWRPDSSDIPAAKFLAKVKKKKGKKSKKKRKKRVSKGNNDKFYSSYEWRALRVRVLEKYECKCMMCGRNPQYHNVILNVDHIKPRKKYPELSLVFENLQILCGACNHGKGNKFETDYRPNEDDIDEMLDREMLSEAISRI